MNIKIKLVAVFTLFTLVSSAQKIGVANAFNEDFWVEKPTLTDISEDELKAEAVFLADMTVCRYEYGLYQIPSSGNWTDKTLIEKNLYYKRIRLNTDKAVEEFNKVYISMLNYKRVTNLKARAIAKDGTVTVFDDSNKKEVDNYENYGPFTIFALEGIEVGAEIEYTYSTEEPATNFIFSINVQNEHPKHNYHYEIQSPEALVFKMKSYNGLPEMVLDTSFNEEINRYVLNSSFIPKFKEEDYSLKDALKQRIEVKLFENKAMGRRNFYSFTEAATEYKESIYGGSDAKMLAKEQKSIKKLVKSQKWDKITNTKEQIIAIEHHIKNNFEKTGERFGYINSCISEKKVSKSSANRLYALIFDYLDIDHQIVITSDRFEKSFDEDFETHRYFDAFLIYFPKYDQYMIPFNDYFRFGLIPSAYAYNKGLFLKMINAGGVRSAYPEIKYINGTMANVNYDNLTADIEFIDEFDKVKAHLKHEINGYSAAYLRPIFPYLSDEKKEETLEERLQYIGEDAEITNIKSSNGEMEGYMLEKPFIFEGDAELSSLIEKAGNKYLFKLGMVIGPQMELYQDTARTYDVENSYNHGYKRVLKIKIPDGYQITNLDDLNMDVYSSVDGEKTMEFTSTYVIEGSTLTVTCNEYYDEIRIPLARYEEFRSVINAAADFNKITLVFELK